MTINVSNIFKNVLGSSENTAVNLDTDTGEPAEINFNISQDIDVSETNDAELSSSEPEMVPDDDGSYYVITHKDGKTIKVHHDEDGSFIEKIVSYKDESGNNIEEFYDLNDIITLKTSIDDNSTKAAATTYKDGKAYKTEVEYMDDNEYRVIEKYDGTGKFISKKLSKNNITDIYDAKNRLTEHNENGVSHHYKYDEKNQVIEHIINDFGPHIMSESQSRGSWDSVIQDSGISENRELCINRKIDETVKQGRTGDCWMLSAVNALNVTEKGREIIRRAIVPNEDGTVTVNFAGSGKSFTITPDEIRQHDTDNNLTDEFSNGDNDMLVLEIAMEKLMKDKAEKGEAPAEKDNLEGGVPMNFWREFIPNCNMLTMYKSVMCYQKGLNDDKINELIDKAIQNKGNTALSFGLDASFGEHKAILADGTPFEWKYGGHALAIINADEKYITFTNPYDSSKPFVITREEFVKLDPASLTLADFTNSL